MEQKKKLKEKLKDVYRLIVIDVEDLREVGKYQFTMAKLYTWITIALLLISFFIVSVIAFTPLRRLMPGYGDIEEHLQFIELKKEMKYLEEELETQVVYTQGLQNMLAGIDDESNSNLKQNTPKNNLPKEAVLITQDELQESKMTQNLNNQYFVPPIIGSISAGFDRMKNHLGVDVLAPKNSPIKSITAGVVVSADFTLDTGNTIMIQHPNNVVSVYKHNSALLKKAGDRITAGEAIAIIGNTGTLTDGPHLHFELWYEGNPVNPSNFIAFQ